MSLLIEWHLLLTAFYVKTIRYDVNELVWRVKHFKHKNFSAYSKAPLASMLLGSWQWKVYNDSKSCASSESYTRHIGINKRLEVRLIIRPSSPRRRFVLFFPFRLVVGLIMRPTSAHFVQNPSENETRLNFVVFLIIRSYFKTIFPFMFYLTFL